MSVFSSLPGLWQMVSALVASPSVSSTRPEWDQGNRDVIAMLAQWCETAGFTVEMQPLPGSATKYNLTAVLGPAEKPGGLLLSGHTDTVPYDEGRWSSDPFQLVERDNRWYGLGVTDMKAFFALALEAAVSCRDELTRPLRLYATADEESTMEGIRSLEAQLSGLDCSVVIGEPTGMRPVYAHKGILMEELQIEGKSGHSSDPALGRNAIDALSGALQSLVSLRQSWKSRYKAPTFRVPSATLNFGCVHGGDNPNRICAHCALQFDVRLVPGLSPEQARQEIRDTLEPLSRRYGVELRYQALFKGVAAFEASRDARIVRSLEQLSGKPADTVAFATEASFFQKAGLSTVVWGPGDIAQAHQPDEFLALDRLAPSRELLSRLIREYCVEDNGADQH